MKFGSPFASGHILTRGFWFRDALYYLGIHLAADYIARLGGTQGAALIAMEAGTVTSAWDVSGYRGWLVRLVCANGWVVVYAHMRERSPLPDGTWVNKGDVVGYADSTGRVTGPHVHVDLLNLAVKSLEATWKLGYFAHDPQLWIGKEQGTTPPSQEDDMTPEQATQLADVWHALFDSVPNPVGGTARRLDLINVAAQSAYNVDTETDAMIAAFPDLATQFDQIDTALFNLKAEFRNVGFGLSPTDAGPLSIGLAKVVKAAAPSLDEGVLRDLFKKALT